MTPITIGGLSATGTSTAAKVLAQTLGWGEALSAGTLMRMQAAEAGFATVDEYHRAMPERIKTDDRAIDGWIKGLARSKKPFILEARLGWFFLPKSFKVLLTCPDAIRGERGLQRDAKKYNLKTHHDALSALNARDEKDLIRLHSIYHKMGRFDDPTKFDMVIDSGVNDPEQIASLIIGEMSRRNLLSAS